MEKIPKSDFKIVSISDIETKLENVRKIGDISELKNSIQKFGLIMPLTVMPKEDNKYLLIAGFRRFAVLKELKVTEIAVFIKYPGNLDEINALQISENVQRVNLTPLEEAAAFKRFKDKPLETIAKEINKSVYYVQVRMKLNELMAEIQEFVKAGIMDLTYAYNIARLNIETQKKVFKFLKERSQTINKKLILPSFADFKRFIGNLEINLIAAPFKLDKEFSIKEKGIQSASCLKCSLNTAAAEKLFPEYEKKAFCLNPDCYNLKVKIHLASIENSLKAKDKTVKVHLLSDSYAFKKDYLDVDKYCRIESGEKCNSNEKGIIAEGDAKNIGKVYNICTDKNCTVHFKRGHKESDYEKRAKEEIKKNRKNNLIRKNLLYQMFTDIKEGRFSNNPIRFDFGINVILEKFFSSQDFNTQKQIIKIMSGDGSKKEDSPLRYFMKELEKKENRKNNYYFACFVLITFVNETMQNYYMTKPKKQNDRLLNFAKYLSYTDKEIQGFYDRVNEAEKKKAKARNKAKDKAKTEKDRPVPAKQNKKK